MTAKLSCVWRTTVTYRTIVIVAAAALTGFCAALIVALQFSGRPESDLSPTIGTIIGLVAPTLVALVTLVRLQDTQQQITDVQNKVNGHLTRLSQAAGLTPPQSPQEGNPDGTSNPS